MRNKYFWLAIAVCNFMNAQSPSIEMGLEGGPGTSIFWCREGVVPGHKFRPTYATGLTVQSNFNSILSLRSGVSFEKKGSLVDIELTDVTGGDIGTAHLITDMNYFLMPVLLRVNLGKKVKFFCNAGFYVAYLQQSQIIAEGILIGKSKSVNTNSFNSFDLGATCGLGISIPVSKQVVIGLESRSNIGLVPINTFKFGNDFRTFSAVVLMSVAYQFGK